MVQLLGSNDGMNREGFFKRFAPPLEDQVLASGSCEGHQMKEANPLPAEVIDPHYPLGSPHQDTQVRAHWKGIHLIGSRSRSKS